MYIQYNRLYKNNITINNRKLSGTYFKHYAFVALKAFKISSMRDTWVLFLYGSLAQKIHNYL